MLWSMIKVLFFVALVGLLTWAANYWMDVGSEVRIIGFGRELNLSPLMVVTASLIMLATVWLVFRAAALLVAVIKFLNGDDTALSRYFDRNRERRGFEALAEGMMAVASGEGRLAMAKAAKAEKYLNRPDLTNLIVAQAAEISNDRRKAEDTYKRLLTDDRTRFVGVRGILKQKLSDGDTDTALQLAEKAFALKPKHEEVQDTLLQLQAQNENWTGARETLGAKLRYGALPRDVHKRRDAVLALSQAMEGDDAAARDHAIEANKLSPDLVPAAVKAAEALVTKGQERPATRVIKTAWEATPHPDLAAAFAAIHPDETPDDRISRFQTLTKLRPDHPETRMLLAELYIAAEDFPAARKALGDLYETDPTQRSLTIMAAVERGEGSDDTVVRAWLTKALTAPRDAQWVCENCGNVHGTWAPVCAACDSFDTLDWKRPSEGDPATSGSAQMLPLIVGSMPADPPEPAPFEDEVTLDATVEEVLQK
ncbi:heme biosynthesis protein HemY [Actibacterium sp. 188UL27-1]|uniref:heme biosynthesis protein HemY n=1 Tax=Actibacterium sp. 188UL27-1 TaxID=2786961 RepID=UPI00195AB0E3|nr:heme biosynthesis HemY N-terminal domain-containing protein [Actibacterium sp. 188UL27-1]MBM7067213.1 tetratricopeptide repeat protein [Actibacterium sp. 188UL27-1]